VTVLSLAFLLLAALQTLREVVLGWWRERA
jgi:hypothetical protein